MTCLQIIHRASLRRSHQGTRKTQRICCHHPGALIYKYKSLICHTQIKEMFLLFGEIYAEAQWIVWKSSLRAEGQRLVSCALRRWHFIKWQMKKGTGSAILLQSKGLCVLWVLFFKMQHTDKSATHLNLRALQVCFWKIYVYVINIKTIFVRSLFTL